MLENNNISDRCNNTDNEIVFDKLKGIKKKKTILVYIVSI